MAGKRDLETQIVESKWRGLHTIGLLAILVITVIFGLQNPSTPVLRVWSWLDTLLLLTAFAILAGHGVTGKWQGFLIDERNKISLSRLQMVLWTILVLSGYLSAALTNVRNGQPDPLAIAIPSQLWLLMGISTTSLVGTPLIRSTKESEEEIQLQRTDPGEPMNEPAEEEEISLTRGLKRTAIRGIATRGTIVYNTSADRARWADLFKGEEIGNFVLLDLGKIQMFYFTFVLVFVYAVTLGSTFAHAEGKITDFPALDTGMIALLGISHAGYLANKAVPRM
jgi:hypothetical protein